MTEEQLTKVNPDTDTEAILTRYQAILAANGIDAADVVPAEVEVSSATDFLPLMGPVNLLSDNETPGLVLADGTEVKCAGVTPPLILLNLAFRPGDRYKNDDKNKSYTGFYTVTVLNTLSGKQAVVTISKPELDSNNGMGQDLEGMKRGNIFRVAHIRTSSGFRVFRAIPLR